MSLKVAVFTFNTNAQIFCCECYDKKTCGLGRKLLDKVSNDCVMTEFAYKFLDEIKKKNEGNEGSLPDVIVVNLQESSMGNPKKKLRSDQLIQAFKSCIQAYDRDYVCAKEKLGTVTSDGVRGLRTGLFVNQRTFDTKFKFYFYKSQIENNIDALQGTSINRGAILLDLTITKGSDTYDLQVINTHLPYITDDSDIDENEKSKRDLMLERIQSGFIAKMGGRSDVPRIIAGNLNYRMDFGLATEKKNTYITAIKSGQLDKSQLPQYVPFDQLQGALSGRLNNYREGLAPEKQEGQGPTFLPTCILAKRCPIVDGQPRAYQYGKDDAEIVPSWCDRILYTKGIKCIMYDSFDTDTTCRSDHIPVIGIYEVQPQPQRLSVRQWFWI